MKIRKGFVSNSSSSSFIISIPNIKNLTYEERYTLYEENVLRNYGYENEDEDEYMKDEFEACINELKNNRVVIMYSEDYTENSLFGSELKDMLDIKVVYDEN